MTVNGGGTENPSPLVGEGDSVLLHRAGRGGGAAVLLARARSMRSAMTPAEATLWPILRAKRLDSFKFKRRAPIGAYIADFVCYALQIIIEADGSQHAESERDRRRTAWLEGQGFTVLRFWNADILARPDDVAQAIFVALTTNPSPRSAAPSRPLPQGERKEQEPQ